MLLNIISVIFIIKAFLHIKVWNNLKKIVIIFMFYTPCLWDWCSKDVTGMGYLDIMINLDISYKELKKKLQQRHFGIKYLNGEKYSVDLVSDEICHIATGNVEKIIFDSVLYTISKLNEF